MGYVGADGDQCIAVCGGAVMVGAVEEEEAGEWV